MATVGFYGMLPALVSEAATRYRASIVAFLTASAIIVAVGFSRVYIGLHWFTDVAGGFLVGGFLMGTVVVLGTYQALRGHRLDRSRCSPQYGVDQPSRSPSLLARQETGQGDAHNEADQGW